LTDSLYCLVLAAEWTKLGLPGVAPQVRAFESEETFVYREEGQMNL